ncbi:hypothetical protein [Oceanospirillum maris]|jgi:hypothetical protein|uniref:hypothetical protein n=1 Tax=Oceanospirillum maris TaxID=64977 RepID=UPI0012FE8458|nr:hypothetical protein [Oceanospirillum maris]
MTQQYMTLGYYHGFNKMFRPTYDIFDCEGNPVYADTKMIKQLVSDGVIADPADREGLEKHLVDEGVLHGSGHLLDGIALDRAKQEPSSVDIPPMDDEKRFVLAWSTLNKIPVRRGKSTRSVKLPIGEFPEGTPIVDLRRKLIPAFPDFDIESAINDGVNIMLIKRREELLLSKRYALELPLDLEAGS